MTHAKSGNTKVVPRTRILLTYTRDEQVCCAAAKTCMKNIVLAQLTKCLEYMLHSK